MSNQSVDEYFEAEAERLEEIALTVLYGSMGHTTALEQAIKGIDKAALVAKMKEEVLSIISFEEIQDHEEYMRSEQALKYQAAAEMIGTVFQDTLAEIAGEN